MDIQILAFGIARDILEGSTLRLRVAEGVTVGEVKDRLFRDYPALAELVSLRIAVNSEYAEEGQALSPDDEVVLIPPVSGG